MDADHVAIGVCSRKSPPSRYADNLATNYKRTKWHGEAGRARSASNSFCSI